MTDHQVVDYILQTLEFLPHVTLDFMVHQRYYVLWEDTGVHIHQVVTEVTNKAILFISM